MGKPKIVFRKSTRDYYVLCPACAKEILPGKALWECYETPNWLGDIEIGCSKKCAKEELQHQRKLEGMD